MRGNLIKLAAFGLLIVGATDAKAQQTVRQQVVNGGGGATALTYCMVGTVASGTCSMPVSITGSSGETVAIDQTTQGSTNGVVAIPGSVAAAGNVPVKSSAVETSHVIKASAGNLYSFNVSADATLAAAQWEVLIFNSTTAPAAGAVAPIKCYIIPAGGTSISAAFPTPIYFSTGISMTVSTAATCFTQTDSAHAFISGDAK